MADSLAGKLFIASPILDDPNFARTVILICEHDEHGAFGLVLNRPLDAPVERYLTGFALPVAAPAVVFSGGPVDASAAFALGRGSQVLDAVWSRAVLPGLGLIDLERVPELVGEGIEATRVFSGYAGWTGGQLESEVLGEAWFVVDADVTTVLTAAPERMWREVLRRQPGSLAMFAFYPDDPRAN